MAAALWLGLCAQALHAQPARPLARAGGVTDYRPTLLLCRGGGGGGERVATRTFLQGGAAAYLLVDPDSLQTSVEPATGWSCALLPEERLAATRFGRAIAEAAAAPGRPTDASAYNAGLTRGRGEGVYVTADLCPSHRALDRAVLTQMAALGRPAPIALAVSGSWLTGHPGDLAWLQERARSGELAITWVNHSASHRFVPSLAERRNFMLLPGTDVEGEILGGERRMIEHGLTPSVFFRFPGLVSAPALLRQVADRHLIVLGTNAWLALGQRAHAGSVVLVHMNGNEESGISALSRLLAQPGTNLGRLNDAP